MSEGFVVVVVAVLNLNIICLNLKVTTVTYLQEVDLMAPGRCSYRPVMIVHHLLKTSLYHMDSSCMEKMQEP